MRAEGAILAAGRGERLRISTPKPLLPLLGRPMIAYALEALKRTGIRSPFVITSPALRDELKHRLGPGIRYIVQPRPQGTGDAVSRVRPLLKSPATLIVINADSPLFEPAHIDRLLEAHSRRRARVSFATATVDDPSGLGRVLRDPAGQVANIVEDAEATENVRRIREINAGLYAFDSPAIFDLLDAVRPAGKKRERHLTRAVELAIARGFAVATVAVPPESSIGVNNLAEAASAQAFLLSRKLAQLMVNGVMIDDPANVYVDWDASVGAGTRLLPGTILSGQTVVGNECRLGPSAVIDGSRLGNRVEVRSSYVSGSSLADEAKIGPFAHVRPGSKVGRGAHVGSHAELVRSNLGDRTAMHHFSYIGDAQVGGGTNIGAGAITANFDGSRKWRTRIGRKAFIGSGAVLIAPASIGEGAVIGAGAVLTGRRKVPARSVFYGVPAKRAGRSRGR